MELAECQGPGHGRFVFPVNEGGLYCERDRELLKALRCKREIIQTGKKGACFSGSDENCKGLNQAWDDNWDGGGDRLGKFLGQSGEG